MKESITFDFETLYDNSNNLEETVREAIFDDFELLDIAKGLDFDIDDFPCDLSDAKDFLINCKGMEEPDIYDDVDTIFEGKSHYDIMCMMFFGDEDFDPTHEYFTLNGYGNFGASSNDYNELLESEMPETRGVLDFADTLNEKITPIVEDVVKEAKLAEQIQEFAENNGLEFDIDGRDIELSFESNAGVIVSISFDLDDVKNMRDLADILFDKSMSVDIDDHIKSEMGISGGPDIESIINTYGRDDEAWTATFGDDCDYDRAVELRDDAYEVRGELDRLSLKAGEKHRELEKEEREQEKGKDKKDKGIDR